MIMIADIQRAVAEQYGVPFDSMREPAPIDRRGVNTHDKAHPRQAAMALSALLTEHSMTRIGHFFGGRDRSTVYHACAAVRKRPVDLVRMRRVTLELIRRGCA